VTDALYACGVSHHSAGLDVREAAALDDNAARALLRRLRRESHVAEAAVLATCNRTEIYAAVRSRAEGRAAIRAALLGHTRLDRGRLDCCGFELWDEATVEHLFRVACGLESVVVGESEIAAQVRRAAERARAEETAGPLLTGLFEHALAASRRVRQATAIGVGATSLSSIVADLVADRCGPGPAHVAIVGAGHLAGKLAGAVAGRGVRDLVFVNRNLPAACELAQRHRGSAVGLEQLPAQLEHVDAVILATHAPHPLLGAQLVQEVVARRGSPLLVVDLAVPRNAEPAVGLLDDVEVQDLDAVQALVTRNALARHRAARGAAQLVHGEAARFATRRRQADATPLVRSLWREAERVRAQELAKLDDLSEAERERFDALTRSLVRRLLHLPTQRLREACEAPDGRLKLDLLQSLLDAAPAPGHAAPLALPERDVA
jgi:glutamyl-tRNA reductase